MKCGQCRYSGFDEATSIGICDLEGSPMHPVGGKGCSFIVRSTTACDKFQFWGETNMDGKLMRQTVNDLHSKAKELNEKHMSDNAYLYRLINKDGLYYSPRATGRSWNKDGKYLTRRQLAQVPALVKAQARVEVFELDFVEEVEIGEIER